MNLALKIAVVIAAYLIGSISPSILIGKAKGINIKEEGSGNAGTTNALRVLGKKAAIITLFVDMAKGVAGSLLGLLIFDFATGCFCAVAVFAGHIWPIYYRFKGGKGAATAVGAIGALDWRLAVISLLIAALALVISKRMSVGTLTAAVAFPVVTLFLQKTLFPFALAISLVVIIKHRANVVRLIKGEEPKMSIFK